MIDNYIKNSTIINKLKIIIKYHMEIVLKIYKIYFDLK